MKLGNSPTGSIVNLVRLILGVAALIAIVFSIILVGVLAFGNTSELSIVKLYIALGLFIAGLILLYSAAQFKIQSQPFLLSYLLEKSMEEKVSTTELESLLKTFQAHMGPGGFFNQIGFSGLALGTIASAFAVLIIGLVSLQLNLIPQAQFSVFADLSKLLFGAFIGSFASTPSAKADSTQPDTTNTRRKDK